MIAVVLQLDLVSIILLAVFSLCFLIQMIYYLVFIAKPFYYLKKINTEKIVLGNAQPPVSIIICSKNESQNLSRFLPSVLEQNYPQYEVIVVNDGSTDESAGVLGELEKQYKHLYSTYIPEEAKYLSRKKLAATVGIKAAKYDIILFTEASCEPVSKEWISRMCGHFSGEKSIVLGFSPMVKSSGFKMKFAAYDLFFDGLRYLSLALANHPYRGVGRNMAYKKSHFFEQKGFSRFMHLQAGEDDLFINQIAKRENTSVEIRPESLTSTHLDNFNVWEEMRLCQSATESHYRPGAVLFWKIETFSRIIFWLLTWALIIYGFPSLFLPIFASVLFLIRLLVQLLVINKISQKMKTERFYYTLPLFDFCQPLFDLYIYICHLMRGRKDYTWK